MEVSERKTVAIIRGEYRFYNKRITMRRVLFSSEPIKIRGAF